MSSRGSGSSAAFRRAAPRRPATTRARVRGLDASSSSCRTTARCARSTTCAATAPARSSPSPRATHQFRLPLSRLVLRARRHAARSARDFGDDVLDVSEFRCFDVRVDEWRGLVFVNLDPDARRAGRRPRRVLRGRRRPTDRGVLLQPPARRTTSPRTGRCTPTTTARAITSRSCIPSSIARSSPRSTASTSATTSADTRRRPAPARSNAGRVALALPEPRAQRLSRRHERRARSSLLDCRARPCVVYDYFFRDLDARAANEEVVRIGRRDPRRGPHDLRSGAAQPRRPACTTAACSAPVTRTASPRSKVVAESLQA